MSVGSFPGCLTRTSTFRCGRSHTSSVATYWLRFSGWPQFLASRRASFFYRFPLVCLVAAGFIDENQVSGHGLVTFLFGSAGHNVRLIGMFGAGMVFALFRERIPLLNSMAAISGVALVLGLFSSFVSNLAIGVAGAYLIFWVAYRAPVFSLSRFTNWTDLSYGVHLYAWPIQSAVAFLTHRAINPWAMSGVTLVLAASAAWLSWTFIERPAIRFAHKPIPFSFPSILPREAFGRGVSIAN